MNTTIEEVGGAGAGVSMWPVMQQGESTRREVWRLVTETVKNTDGLTGGALPNASQAAGLHPVTLLQIITYYYALGTLSSQAIGQEAMRDPRLSNISSALQPDGWQIQRFRRGHLSLLKQTLSRVFQHLLKREDTGYGHSRLSEWQVTWQSEQAANECLNQAIFLDSMSLDE